MARLVTTGFEWNDFAHAAATHPDPIIKGGVAGALSIGTTTPRTGTYALKIAYANASTCTGVLSFTATTAVSYFFRVALMLDIAPASLAASFKILQAQSNLPTVWLNTDGSLTSGEASGTTFAAAGSVVANTYFVLEALCKVDSGNSANALAQVSFNGGAPVSLSFASTTLPTSFDFGVVGRSVSGTAPGTFNIYADDVALNDDTGAAQNTWAGTGQIVLLRPTADSAVGTGWTLGNTTATGGNAWSRLNKAPPDSATDLTTTADADQIRNASSNANVNYDATMTTYTVAGASGTVNVVVPIVATGAPVVTSAKAGTVGVASNPAITNVALGAGGTAGAFWSGVATGTYPTGNKWSFGTTTYAPTVTLGTAPVMRVTQVTASTRIAIVTEMGIYVDYTPAVVIAPTPLVHQSIPFYPRPSLPG